MKKLAVLLSLVVMLTTINFSCLAKSRDISGVFPNMPSLLNPGYAESLDELTTEQKKSVVNYGYYIIDGEEESHGIDAFTGTMGGSYRSSDLVMRADIELKNTNSKLSEMLSDNGIINIRILIFNTYAGNITAHNSYLCIYGNKAEQWFRDGYGMFLPKSVYENNIAYANTEIYSTEEEGCLNYLPIVCVREEYRDKTWLSDYKDFEIFIEYEDEEWLIPKNLTFQWEYGLNETVDINDVKATSNFRESLVSLEPKLSDKEAQAAREAKYEEYYANIPEYDPFSDENYGKVPEEIEKEEEKEEKENQTKKEDIIYEEEPEEIETEKVIIPYDPSMTQEELDSLFQPQPIPVPDKYDDEGTTYYNVGKDGKPVENPVSIYIDGKLILPEQAPIVDNNRTLVPMRIIFEALGAEVIWKAEDKTITARKEDKVVVLQIGNSVMKNGESEIPLDTAPVLQNSFTMIPVRAVAEAFDADVIWNEFDKAVVIETR